ncbi:hypothetical protein SCUCBS95973_008676 [Sporothrix curviconia]|uniref:Transmembrane protein n=1 Tax=Sporothrix curviconia TaxID=1260050 RepID=A0ABP0CNK7_9PEZI
MAPTRVVRTAALGACLIAGGLFFVKSLHAGDAIIASTDSATSDASVPVAEVAEPMPVLDALKATPVIEVPFTAVTVPAAATTTTMTRPLNQAEMEDPRLLNIPEPQRQAFHYSKNGALVEGAAPHWGEPYKPPKPIHVSGSSTPASGSPASIPPEPVEPVRPVEVLEPVVAQEAVETAEPLETPDPLNPIVGTPAETEAADSDVVGVDGTLAALERFMADLNRGQSTIEHELSAFDKDLNPNASQGAAVEADALFQQLKYLSSNAMDAAADLKAFMSEVEGKHKAMQQLAEIAHFTSSRTAQEAWMAENPEDDTPDNVKREQTTHPKLMKREMRSDEEEDKDPQEKFPWMKDASVFGMHLYR